MHGAALLTGSWPAQPWALPAAAVRRRDLRRSASSSTCPSSRLPPSNSSSTPPLVASRPRHGSKKLTLGCDPRSRRNYCLDHRRAGVFSAQRYVHAPFQPAFCRAEAELGGRVEVIRLAGSVKGSLAVSFCNLGASLAKAGSFEPLIIS